MRKIFPWLFLLLLLPVFAYFGGKLAAPPDSDLNGALMNKMPGAFTVTAQLSCTDGTMQVALSWGISPNATSYRVERRPSPKGAWTALTPWAAQYSFSDTSIALQTAYDYRIAAMNGPHKRYSNTVTLETPASCSVTSSSSSTKASSSSVPPRSSSSSSSTPSALSSSVSSSMSSISSIPLRSSSSSKSSIPSMSSSSSSPAPVPISNKIWGAYVGWEASNGPAFEQKVGKTMKNRAVFVHWGNENEFPSYLASVLQGKTLTIFWEAMDYNDSSTNQTRFSYAAILRGDWDAYITSFASEAKAYGGPVILIPFEEMNGDWYTWSGSINGNTPADHIAAYRYLRGFFRDAPNVKFGWAPNSDSSPDTSANSIAAYYPGAEYVDIVGVDGFNFGSPWLTFDQIFGSALRQLKTYGKPLYIFSIASAEDVRKAAWITDALGTQMINHPEITGWIWFNENKEHDWRVWSDDASLKAFQSVLP